jgi:glycosyltransferase involved in cell wall biosynthesis
MLGGAEIFALERMRQAPATPVLHCNAALSQRIGADTRYAAIRRVTEHSLDELAVRISPRNIRKAARGLATVLQGGEVVLGNLRAASIQLASAHAGRNDAFIHDNSHYLNLKARLLLTLIVARSRRVFFPCRHSTLEIPFGHTLRRRIAVEYFAPYREITPALARDSEGLRALTIGRIGPDKNQLGAVHIATALARRFERVRLTLLGEVMDERYFESLSRAAAPHVELCHQQVPRSKVPEILKAHDLVIHTSLIESLPLVLFEANACGVPCFAFPVGGIPEVLPQRYRLEADPDTAAGQIAAFFGCEGLPTRDGAVAAASG